ncbi:hypothetical protein B0H66DRAFT_563048 [Apodospora peruviana]|uniref:C2H2-type domain-containing protein n=1 Tax=Apodospora peruviana TaxID=516989 RepID=A0AAE0HX56_9PEZI|nr:hypothetical protein B0H66DRAFT_563048 [Apodospora peruviana]
MEQEEFSAVACFRCQDVFVSANALKVHLQSCTDEFEPRRSEPWAFIPPPTHYGNTSTRRTGYYPPRGQGRDDRARYRARGRGGGSRRRPSNTSDIGDDSPSQVITQTSTWAQQLNSKVSTSSDGGNSSPVMNYPVSDDEEPQSSRGRGRGGRPGQSQEVKCTKCNISFATPQGLAEHFYQSEAHPFSVPPVGNRWQAPQFRVTQSQSQSPRSPIQDIQKEESKNKVQVECECGRLFDSREALVQHRRSHAPLTSSSGTFSHQRHAKSAGIGYTGNGVDVSDDDIEKIRAVLRQLGLE